MATNLTSLPAATIAYIAQRLSKTFAPYGLVPFNFIGPVTDRQRVAGGQLRVGVTCAQGSTVAVAHNLAKVPTGVMLLDNGTTAQTLLTVSARSSTSVTIEPLTAALSSASVLFIF